MDKNYGLDLHCQMILDEYRDNIESFRKMKDIVKKQMEKCIEENGLYVNAIEARVKTESSLVGKLELKGQKYNSLSDLTDILGARIITFYTDEVDKIAALMEKTFEVDWSNTIDKRKLIDLDRFGYMSLHYICRIPQALYFDPEHPEINEYRFEIQMRTALQHVWATMYHDTGYKSGVEIPEEYLRNLNRLAGLLELADEQFSKIRIEITDYRRQVQALVADGNFDAVALNGDTFRSFLQLNPFRKLMERIASINQAEIIEDSLVRYLNVLVQMDFKTLGDIERMIKENSEAAYQLALHQLAGTDLDIVASSLALQNLCIVSIIKKGYGEIGLKFFYETLYGPSDYNIQRAQRTLQQANRINIK
ncbi:MAG: hypothetical protein MJZ94_06050 [Bacteroidales bacterium]|nr:hypothetical protein [Bacteroidales bacterium]